MNEEQPDPFRMTRRLAIAFMTVVVVGLAIYLAIANPHGR